VDNAYPAATPGSYAVVRGDTLYTVARSVWGDSSLWYLIAEANGLNSPDKLAEGQLLIIPARPGAVHNSSQTIVPYDPSRIVGDTTPYITPQAIPQPAQSAGCSGAQIIVAIIAIAVTIATQGAATEFFAGLLGAEGAAATTAAITEAIAAGTATGAQIGGAIAGAATAAAIGSAVGQGVGIAIGIQDKFSWKQVGVAAVTAGVTQGLAPSVNSVVGKIGSDLGQQVARGAINSALSQGVRIAMGVQSGFNWKMMAGTAIAQPIVDAIDDQLIGQAIQGPVRPGEAPLGFTGMLPGAVGATAAQLMTRSLQGLTQEAIVTRPARPPGRLGARRRRTEAVLSVETPPHVPAASSKRPMCWPMRSAPCLAMGSPHRLRGSRNAPWRRPAGTSTTLMTPTPGGRCRRCSPGAWWRQPTGPLAG
jgi:hypothetical protein